MKVIAAVKDDDLFDAALRSQADTIFFLYPDIAELEYISKKTHSAGKKLFIHIDLTAGLGKDRSGIEYAKRAGVDGIISTRSGLIKSAKEAELLSVQRFFIVDSHSIDTTVDSLKASKADFIEVMPGIAPKIIKKLKERVSVPIIAGGLIDDISEVKAAESAGAYAVSTGCEELWR